MQQPRTPTSARTLVEVALVVLLVGTIALLPLAFVPALDDAYILPKSLLLRVAALGAAALFVAYLALDGEVSLRFEPSIDIPLAVFGVLLVLSTALSVDRGQSLAGEPYQYQGFVTTAVYLATFWAARSFLGTPSRLRLLLGGLVAAGTLVAVYAIAQGAGIDPFWSGPLGQRAISSVGQPNDLAAYLALVVVAAAGLWPLVGSRARAGVGIAVALSIAAIAVTYSRGGYLALIAVVAVLVLPRLRAPRRRELIAAAALLGVVVVAVLLSSALRDTAGAVIARAASSSDLEEGSIRGHMDLWRLGIAIAFDHPLIGTGPETFPVVFASYLPVLFDPARATFLASFRLESPHSELIGFAAGMGLPAMVAFVAFLAGCAAMAGRLLRAERPLIRAAATTALGVLAVHVVANSFKTPDITTSAVFYAVLGAALATACNAARSPAGAKAGAEGEGGAEAAGAAPA